MFTLVLTWGFFFFSYYSYIAIFLPCLWRKLGPLVCDLHEGMHHGRKWKTFSRILRCGNMTSATGNMMFLQAASHDTASELLLSLSSLHSHPQFRTLSILVLPPNPKSTRFHANAWLVTSFFFPHAPIRGEFALLLPLLRRCSEHFHHRS